MCIRDSIALVLHSKDKQFTIRGEPAASYEDLQKGPVILLGAFNNDWVIYLTRSMHYHFAQNTDGFQWIEDQKNPSAKIGLQRIDKDTFGPQEFGLVARVIDSETKQPIIIIGGVTPVGSAAGGQLVTNPQLLSDLLKTVPENWQSKNLEVLFSVNVIDNQPGPPHVVASVVW